MNAIPKTGKLAAFMAELDKSGAAISAMFARIAPRYDLVNHVLSANADRRWRRTAARSLNGRHRLVLDLATGTGDLAVACSAGDRRIVGVDFCLDMVARAGRKARGDARIRFSAADALALPFSDGSFDAVTIAFGVRNFADLRRGLLEIRRVLRPGGTLLVLEFSQPRGPLGAFYRLYSDRILPRIGGLLSGSRAAYSYLNRSARDWPDRTEFARILSAAGFSEISATALSLGVVALHEATRP